MTTITINTPDDIDQIIEHLDAMPMTRKHGKGLIAVTPIYRPKSLL